MAGDNQEPIWIKIEAVLAVHGRQLAEHGGGEGVRDLGLLESALDRPKNLYHYTNPKPSLAAIAASYAFGIASDHPFIDGNKRTSLIASQLFLRLNGQTLSAAPSDKYNIFMQLAAGKLSQEDLADWFENNL